jgi:acetyltransferase-like isoleucine patch superfamily enzyme
LDRISRTSIIEAGASIGRGARIWDLAHIRSGARIGEGCTIGRNVFIDHDVVVGNNCKIQNNALVYAPAVLGTGVFVGPGAILTNDRRPRAVNPDFSLKDSAHWRPAAVVIGDGASIGAGAVVVAGTTVGSWAMVAAGAVVAADVAPYALVAGVPARWVQWLDRTGQPLQALPGGGWFSPETGEHFREDDHGLVLTS